jgi:tripartite-type tricarboxylate transporter receptor subunit TctC
VGSVYAKNQKADGYTILFVPLAQFLWNPMDRPEVNFHHSDFRLLAGISEYQMGIVATPDKPYKTLDELVAYSKKNPGLNVADMGGLSKAFINYIAKQKGVDWTPIPTRGGGEMVPFLLGGKVDFAFSGGVHQKYGDKMLVLAAFTKTRLPLAPNAPSTHELYGISMPGNAIMVAPKGIPDDIAMKLEAALKKSMDDKDFTKILQKIQFPKRFIPSSELKPFLLEAEKGMKTVLDSVRAG